MSKQKDILLKVQSGFYSTWIIPAMYFHRYNLIQRLILTLKRRITNG